MIPSGDANHAQAEFLTLFLQHQADLRAFIGSVVRDRAARDDLFQETTLVLWQEFSRYDAARPFGAWARGIAAKKLLQWFERGQRWPQRLPDAAIPAILSAFDRTAGLDSERRDALDRCLEKLPERSRKLLRQRYLQAMPVAEIAVEIRSTTEAVHRALSRVREKLRGCVERQLRSLGGP